MNQEQINQNNVLIARFMGKTISPEVGSKEYNNWQGGRCDYSFYEVKFNSSYNWLMPVVEKIEKDNYGFKMCRKVVEIYYDDSKELILKTKEKDRISSLYKAVVDFIKWYNLTKI